MGRQQWQLQRCGTEWHDTARVLVCRVGALSFWFHEWAKEMLARFESSRSNRQNGLEALAYKEALATFIGSFPLAHGRMWRTDTWNFWHIRRTKWLFILQKAFYGWRSSCWHSRASSDCTLILADFASTFHRSIRNHETEGSGAPAPPGRTRWRMCAWLAVDLAIAKGDDSSNTLHTQTQINLHNKAAPRMGREWATTDFSATKFNAMLCQFAEQDQECKGVFNATQGRLRGRVTCLRCGANTCENCLLVKERLGLPLCCHYNSSPSTAATGAWA